MERAVSSEVAGRNHVLRMIEIKRHRIECVASWWKDAATADLIGYVMDKLEFLLPQPDSCPDRLNAALRETSLPEWVQEANLKRINGSLTQVRERGSTSFQGSRSVLG